MPRLADLQSRRSWLWACVRGSVGYKAEGVKLSSERIGDGTWMNSVRVPKIERVLCAAAHAKHVVP